MPAGALLAVELDPLGRQVEGLPASGHISLSFGVDGRPMSVLFLWMERILLQYYHVTYLKHLETNHMKHDVSPRLLLLSLQDMSPAPKTLDFFHQVSHV